MGELTILKGFLRSVTKTGNFLKLEQKVDKNYMETGIIKEKGQKEEADHIEDTQRLVTERLKC